MKVLQLIAGTLSGIALVLGLLNAADIRHSDWVTRFEVEAALVDMRNDIMDLVRVALSERFAYFEANVEERLASVELQQEDVLGVPTVPAVIANFETSLASSITDSATSMTLVSFTDKDGNDLTTGTYYGFTIDEGTANEEHVIGMATSSNVVTNMTRGVSVTTGSTSVTALQKTHRRGASVKITDAPSLVLISLILRGEEEVNYTPTATGHLTTKDYVDSLALGTTTVAALETDDGIVELATQLEMASSTNLGGSGSSLVLQSQYATSSPGTTGAWVPITDPTTGLLTAAIMPTTFTANTTFSGTLTVGSELVTDMHMYMDWASTTGTSTWSVPSGVTRIKVTLIGPGGDGSTGNAGTPGTAGSGGGAGGICIEYIDVSATSTLQYHLGTYPEYSWFGGTYDSPMMQANAGNPGAAAGGAGGSGGTATGCDIAVTGTGGDPGINDSNSDAYLFGGSGGYSPYGEAGRGVGQSVTPRDATGCGAGGGGGVDGYSDDGVGADGCVIIEY